MLDFRFSQNIYAVTIIRTLNIHFSFYFKYFISFQLEFQCIMLLVHNMKFNLPLGITIFSLYFLLSLASAVFVRASLSPRRCLCCRSVDRRDCVVCSPLSCLSLWRPFRFAIAGLLIASN